MILRNIKFYKKILIPVKIENFSNLKINNFSTNNYLPNSANISNNGNKDKINRTELITQLISLYRQNNTIKRNKVEVSNTAFLYTNWEYLEGCFMNNNFVKLDQELKKLNNKSRTDLRRAFTEFSLLLENPEMIEPSRFNSITIIVDHFVKYLISRNPYFLNTIGLKVEDMKRFFNLIYSFSKSELSFRHKLKLIKCFLSYFELANDLKGLTLIYNNLLDLMLSINRKKKKTLIEAQHIWYHLMISLAGLDNDLSLKILGQLWHSYDYKNSTLPHPLDYLVRHCLLSTSASFKVSIPLKVSKLEILFPLYEIVKDYVTMHHYTLNRFNVDIQKIYVGMGHCYGLSNNIDGLMNFMDEERLVPPNHYAVSTIIHHIMRLGFHDVGARIFNQFVKDRLNSKSSTTHNAPYAVLLQGFGGNKQWDALSNYFELRKNLPVVINPKLYEDIIFGLKTNLPPSQLIQSIYYSMVHIDKVMPTVRCLDVIARQLPHYRFDFNNQNYPLPLGQRLNNFYNTFITNSELDMRFFNTMIYQLVTNTPKQDLESITVILSNLYKGLIQKGLKPTTPFLTTMLIVYLKLGRSEGVEEILTYLKSNPNLIDYKLHNLLKNLKN